MSQKQNRACFLMQLVSGMLLCCSISVAETIDDVLEKADREAPKTVQVPLFEDGKFKGYIEQPLEPDRRPDSIELKQGSNIQLEPNTTQDENSD